MEEFGLWDIKPNLRCGECGNDIWIDSGLSNPTCPHCDEPVKTK